MTSKVETNRKQFQIDFTKSQLDPFFASDYKKHLEKTELTRLVEIEEMLCGSYEILEHLGLTFEEIKNSENVAKLDLWDFEDHLINSLNSYVDKNDYGNLSELFHPLDFVKIFGVKKNHAEDDREKIAEKVYSYFHSIGLNYLFYNYIVKTISKSRYETLAAPQYLASLWATITFINIALATDNSDIDEASRSFSLALAYFDSWQHIIKGIEIFDTVSQDCIEDKPPIKTRSNDFSDIAQKAIQKYLDDNEKPIDQIQPRHVLNYTRSNPFKIWGDQIYFPDKRTIAFSGGSTPTDLFRKRIQRQLDKLSDKNESLRDNKRF